jgi:hypothetical protein
MIKKEKPLINRREFLITTLFVTASAFLSACSQAIEKALGFEASAAECEEIGPLAIDESLNRSRTRLAKKRELTDIDHAIIHHSQYPGAAGKCELIEAAREYEKLHSERDYSGDGLIDAYYTVNEELPYKWISYHYLIARDGYVLPLQDAKFVRIHAHNDVINATSIAICLDGDFRSIDEGGRDERPSVDQLLAAARIIRKWNCEHETELIIKAHGEVAIPSEKGKLTDCPGAHLGSAADPDSNLQNLIRLVDVLNCKDI